VPGNFNGAGSVLPALFWKNLLTVFELLVLETFAGAVFAEDGVLPEVELVPAVEA
jgi:hypothetical protein